MATNKTPEQKMIDRLSRAEGQIRALKNYLESGKIDCKSFITQVKAVRSALKAVNEEFIIAHIDTCQNLPEKKREAQMAEAIRLLIQS
ncbi:metal-sensitive transcriptional regulator [Candidatus Nomurabacteria bacterium]|nr:metal-sensitive transcriptional regulator [Candidatus Kaiserbacteria bacterium]MCB9814484.1 metal-sensitive transcriptional regulator [Candidatus Nomurabacteria bacterium]